MTKRAFLKLLALTPVAATQLPPEPPVTYGWDLGSRYSTFVCVSNSYAQHMATLKAEQVASMIAAMEKHQAE